MNFEEAMRLHREFEGQTQWIEAHELYQAVLNTPSGAVVEVGSATGGTTIVLIAAASKVGKKVISVDPCPEKIEGEALFYNKGMMSAFKKKFEDNILNKAHDVIQYNSDLSECINEIPSVSVAFIDGCHEIDFANREYSLLLSKMVKGGVIYFHDVNWERGQLTGESDRGLNQLTGQLNGDIIGTMLKIVI